MLHAPIHMRSIMLGALLVKRLCGDSVAIAVELPTDPGTELCLSKAESSQCRRGFPIKELDD